MIRTEVLEKLDHKNLNLDVDFMKGIMPSCENLVAEIWKIIDPKIPAIAPQAQLHSIKLYETPRNFVEYLG